MYSELIKDPIRVAVFSALIGVAVAHVYRLCIDASTRRRKREAALRLLASQLLNHKSRLIELEDSLSLDQVVAGLDPSPILQFLASDSLNLPLDSDLANALYEHLANISKLDRAIDVLGMRVSGFTSVQNSDYVALKAGLKKSIPGMMDELDTCLRQIDFHTRGDTAANARPITKTFGD